MRWIGERVVGRGAEALCIVDHGGEDQHAQRQEDDEQQELVGAGPERVAQDPQAYKVTRELEDAQDPDEPHHAQEAQNILGGLGGEAAQPQLQVERQDGHKVDDVQRVLRKLQPVGAEDDAHQELKR